MGVLKIFTDFHSFRCGNFNISYNNYNNNQNQQLFQIVFCYKKIEFNEFVYIIIIV